MRAKLIGHNIMVIFIYDSKVAQHLMLRALKALLPLPSFKTYTVIVTLSDSSS